MLTALADRITARPKRALLAVVAFVIVAGVLGGPVTGALQSSGGFTAKDAGSALAVERIVEATGRESAPGVVLLLATPRGVEAARERLATLRRELGAVPGVATVLGPDGDGDSRFVAGDGRSAYVAGVLEAGADRDAVATAVLDRYGREPGLTVGGGLIADKQVGDAVGGDLARAEALAFPVLLVLSLLFFRGARAAAIPLVVGLTTVLATFAALRGIDLAFGLSIFALNLVIGLGLGLAIDYALFLVTRYREELATHGPGAAAIRRTMATAGRTVAFSAATVAIALATLTVFPLNFLQSMGIAGAVVALVAAAATLVICPALFAVWGAKLAVRGRRGGGAGPGRWYRLSHAVMRRPGTVALATGLAMIVVALPALRAEFTPVDASVIPTDKSSRTVADTLQARYAGQDVTPLTVVLDAPREAGVAVAAYARGLGRREGVRGVQAPRPLDARTWQVDLAVDGAPEGDRAQTLVREIRDAGAPFPLLVGGAGAEFVDQQAAIASRLPLALGLLVLLTFAVLWLMTGSVVLPLKAIVMNVLTVGSSLGVLVLVFQDGRFTGLLGYTPNGGVEPTDFLVAAALVFALSTDYGVFLFGRIKEAREAGRSEREAVAVGLERTGAVVTAAAVLLAVAIGAFMTSSISFIQQIGVATAAGVLIDAFVVRTFLVPALMGLLGAANWWSPRPLRRLHRRIGPAEA